MCRPDISTRDTAGPSLRRILLCRGSMLSEPAWLLGPNTSNNISRMRRARAATVVNIRGNVPVERTFENMPSSPSHVLACLPRLWLAVARGSGAGTKPKKKCRKPQAHVLASKTGIQLYATAALWGNRMDLSIWPVEKGEYITERKGRWGGLWGCAQRGSAVLGPPPTSFCCW